MSLDDLPATAPDRDDVEAVLRGRHGDPFRVLGMFAEGGAVTVNVFAPDAAEVTLLDGKGTPCAELDRVHPEGFFHARLDRKKKIFPYRLRLRARGEEWERDDPFRFGPVLGEMDEYLMAEGRHEELYAKLGAHPVTHEGVEGTAFAVWAPNARRVSVVGDFNAWDGRRHPMRQRGQTGIWEIFLPGVARGALYKFEILGPQGDLQPLKADPFAFRAEPAPGTASVVEGLVRHEWTDEGWTRARGDLREKPVSIYEVHLGSWRRGGMAAR
jgi:1,4-alpha-glucan branching enzyme